MLGGKFQRTKFKDSKWEVFEGPVSEIFLVFLLAFFSSSQKDASIWEAKKYMVLRKSRSSSECKRNWQNGARNVLQSNFSFLRYPWPMQLSKCAICSGSLTTWCNSSNIKNVLNANSTESFMKYPPPQIYKLVEMETSLLNLLYFHCVYDVRTLGGWVGTGQRH